LALPKYLLRPNIMGYVTDFYYYVSNSFYERQEIGEAQ